MSETVQYILIGVQAFINIGLVAMIMVNHYNIGGMPVYVRRSNRLSANS